MPDNFRPAELFGNPPSFLRCTRFILRHQRRVVAHLPRKVSVSEVLVAIRAYVFRYNHAIWVCSRMYRLSSFA